jgi:hypothetical protein
VNRSRDMAIWNIVPWYVGDEKHVRPVTDTELDAARPALLRLLGLLTELRIVVLLGDKSARGWLRAQIPFPVLAAPHTSPRSLAGRPERRECIRHALTTALREAASRPPFRLSASAPGGGSRAEREPRLPRRNPSRANPECATASPGLRMSSSRGRSGPYKEERSGPTFASP